MTCLLCARWRLCKKIFGLAPKESVAGVADGRARRIHRTTAASEKLWQTSLRRGRDGLWMGAVFVALVWEWRPGRK